MDAASALADLTEISSQFDIAVVLDEDGSVLASTVADDARSERLAKAGVGLLASGGTRTLTRVEAALRHGSVFAARDATRSVVATTAAAPTSSLVFHDLETCLRAIAQVPPKPKRKPRKKTAADA